MTILEATQLDPRFAEMKCHARGLGLIPVEERPDQNCATSAMQFGRVTGG